MTTLAMWTPGWMELMLVLIVALLLFGRRLPEVGRSLGQSLVEFKRGLKGIDSEVESVKREVEQAGATPKNEPAQSKEG